MNSDMQSELVRQRLDILKLAKTLNNVSEACRRSNISRTTFYAYKHRFEEQGLEGLKSLPPIPKSHPFTTPPEVIERIVDISLLHPARGCNFISERLRTEGISVSYPTVQNILKKAGLPTRADRWLRLEQQAADEFLTPTEEQLTFLFKQNPCWQNRCHGKSSRPGEQLCYDMAGVGRWAGEMLQLDAAIDIYSNYGCAFLSPRRYSFDSQPIFVLDFTPSFPFFWKRQISISALLSGDGPLFCEEFEHSDEGCIAVCNIEPRVTSAKHPSVNGFFERFIRILKEEFFCTRQRADYKSISDLDADLTVWLHYYNYERPHYGYPNMGRSPIEMIRLYQETICEAE